eukprot:scaffold26551_cov115-Isochrysis_galbana.AAC.2
MKNKAHLRSTSTRRGVPVLADGKQILQSPGKCAALTHPPELLEELSGGGNPSTYPRYTI